MSAKKQSILFIHGFGKNAEHWDTTENNKEINIVKQIVKKNIFAEVFCVELDETDYSRSTLDVAKDILNAVREIIEERRCIVVAHSSGSFCAMHLATLAPQQFTKLLLLDPTLSNISYKEHLLKKCKEDENDTVSARKLFYFDQLPSIVPRQIVTRIHFNYIEGIGEKVKELYALTKQNTKSRLVLHYDVSHMIHYHLPHVVVDAILELV